MQNKSYGAGPFSFEPNSDYLKLVEDVGLTVSMNYYKYSYYEINVNVNGTDIDSSLTSVGQMYYR